MNVLEENKLIAEFLGGKYQYDTLRGGMGIEQWFFSFNNSPTGDSWGGKEWPVEDLKFHCNWDWLMPVVEKISSIPKLTSSISSTPTISGRWIMHIFKVERENIPEFKMDVIVNAESNYAIAETKIQLVWRGVIEFINWYNLQNHV